MIIMVFVLTIFVGVLLAVVSYLNDKIEILKIDMRMYDDDLTDILTVYSDIKRIDGCINELYKRLGSIRRELADHKVNHVYSTLTTSTVDTSNNIMKVTGAAETFINELNANINKKGEKFKLSKKYTKVRKNKSKKVKKDFMRKDSNNEVD